MNQTTQEALEIFDRLTPADQRLFTDLAAAYLKMTPQERAQAYIFLEAAKKEQDCFRPAMQIVIAAANGSNDAWGVIEATLEEAGA